MRTLYTTCMFLLFFAHINLLKAQDSIQEYKVEKISLKINLEPNTSYRFTNSNNQNIVQELMGDTLEINQKILTNYIFEIEDKTDGEMKVKAFYERLAFDMEMPQGNVTLDTDNKVDSAAHPLSSIVNKPFYLSINSEGKISKIEGLAEIIKLSININQPILQEFLSEKNLISAFENSLNIFSEDSIGMGETWNKIRNQSLNNQFDLNFVESFTLEGLSEDIAWINIESQINGFVSDNSHFDEFTLAGTQEGTIEVDRHSGLILFSEIKQEIQGHMKMQGMEVPIKLSSTNTHTGEKL